MRDIITELETQVEPLRIQSEKASTYLIYRDELRVLEVSVWLDSLDKLRDSLEKARVDFDNAERMFSAKQQVWTASMPRATRSAPKPRWTFA